MLMTGKSCNSYFHEIQSCNIPFLISVSDKVEITGEHSAYRWISLDELDPFDLLEGVKEDLKLVGLI
jgi:hypothetical protein